MSKALTQHPSIQGERLNQGMSKAADIRIGISGWRYKGWRGTSYPDDLPQRKELEFASTHLNSIELNGSFYSLQRPESFARWHEETPASFVFSTKGSQWIVVRVRMNNSVSWSR